MEDLAEIHGANLGTRKPAKAPVQSGHGVLAERLV
jgi:hypothetical protein